MIFAGQIFGQLSSLHVLNIDVAQDLLYNPHYFVAVIIFLYLSVIFVLINFKTRTK